MSVGRQATRRRPVPLFWLAAAASSAATWVLQVALFVHVLGAGSATTLALVELCGTVPALLAMPVAGVLADRAGPRPLAIGSMLAQAACLAAMPVLLGTGLGWITVLYAAQGLANTVWEPARQQWLYRLVPTAERAGANAALGSVSGIMTVLGAAAGGVLSAWGTGPALAVAAGLQLLAVVPLVLLPRVSIADQDSSPPQPFWADLREGTRSLRGLPLARSVVWIGIAWGFIGGGYAVLLASYATEVVHGGGPALGTLYVVDGLGVIAGTWLATRLATGKHLTGYAVAYLAQGAGWAAMFLTGTLALGAALLALMRVASGVIIALDTTILLAGVPARLRGRVTSVHRTTYGVVARLSLAAFAWLLAAFGTHAVGIAAGAASMVTGALWWCWQRTRHPETARQYLDSHEPAAAS